MAEYGQGSGEELQIDGVSAHGFGQTRESRPVPLNRIAKAERRAEIRCRKRHLVGVVTKRTVVSEDADPDSLYLEQSKAEPITGSHEVPVWCRRCGHHHSPDYRLELPRLYALVRALESRPQATWPIQIELARVSQVHPLNL